jgi:hypothetical protein
LRENIKVTLAIVLVFAAMYLFTVLLPYVLEGGQEVSLFKYGTILFLIIVGFIGLVLVVGKVTRQRS